MKHTTKTTVVPPQLIGVHEDAVKIGATSFRLETFPTHVMGSFSTRSEAGEIDFEMEAGREMIDYLIGQSAAASTGRLRLEYEGHRYDCEVTFDKRRPPAWVQVSWA